ncbi:MAG TPA: hypothetical protein PKE57_05985 [Cellvibrionaceae bacterium]|nr:hypothetical protein [Cellvibrionaceae bacterium]HMW48193.1 hypothetical protein [Cellvibrionaceae bacterium]HNG59546.1 hypothetical protein [Cellvibrionaceae bacterium]
MLIIEYLLKTVLCLLLLAYSYMQQSIQFLKMTDEVFSASMEKKNATSGNKYDYIVVGGSNALTGVSARTISMKTNSNAYNLAISACEGAGLLDYPDWLSQSNSTTKSVIYSSMNIWHLARRSPCELYSDSLSNQPYHRPFNVIPLARTISNALQKMSFSINEYGDLTVRSCDPMIPPFDPGYVHTNDTVNIRLKNFIRMVNATKEYMHADEIFVRIPPIYVSPQAVPTFEHYLSYIHTAFRAHGIALLGTEQALTTDSTKMCFGPNHPTNAAREEYTDALIQELTAHKQLVLQ